jgi:signal transduction histidine kinase
MHPAATEWSAVAADLLADTQRLEQLARDLLFLAREDAGPAPRRDLLVDLDDVTLDEAIRLRTGSSVLIDTSEVSAATVVGSRDELGRLVRNLLENAARHAASTVRVSLCVDQANAVLVVQDDGPGVPPGDANEIFERFVRIDGDRARSGGGSGLGLAIARAIAEAHDGTVEVDTAALGGRFVVWLPTSEEPRGSVMQRASPGRQVRC